MRFVVVKMRRGGTDRKDDVHDIVDGLKAGPLMPISAALISVSIKFGYLFPR